MSSRSPSTASHRKKRRASAFNLSNQCISWFVTGLEDNAASMPKIYINGQRYKPEDAHDPNQSQVHFTMTNEGTPRAIKYRLNFLEDENLLNLQQLVPTYPFLTELRFEFCSINYDQMLFIHMILQENPHITLFSLNGTPRSTLPEEAAHHLPLHDTYLKVYSAHMCKLNAHCTNLLYQAMAKPSKFTRHLVYLNLGCNQLGDVGCEMITKILRGNRTLRALNIADNGISEAGLIKFLETFANFKLTEEEVHYKRELRFAQLIKVYFPEMIWDSEASIQSLTVSAKSSSSESVSQFHPLITDSFVKDNVSYCAGNNSLQHLNIAYNDITSKFLEALIDTIKLQKQQLKSGGLQRINIDSILHHPDLKHEVNRLLSQSTHRISKRPASVI